MADEKTASSKVGKVLPYGAAGHKCSPGSSIRRCGAAKVLRIKLDSQRHDLILQRANRTRDNPPAAARVAVERAEHAERREKVEKTKAARSAALQKNRGAMAKEKEVSLEIWIWKQQTDVEIARRNVKMRRNMVGCFASNGSGF